MAEYKAFKKRDVIAQERQFLFFCTIVTHSVLLCYTAIGHFRWLTHKGFMKNCQTSQIWLQFLKKKRARKVIFFSLKIADHPKQQNEGAQGHFGSHLTHLK